MRSLAQQLKEKMNVDLPELEEDIPTDPSDVPMMYRAQIKDRCSLQYGKYNQDLIDWTKQWINPQEKENPQPLYQHSRPELGLDGSIYRIELKFPFRVISNCGQDSIIRPVMGKEGIPYIPGSSIKGLFRRLLGRKNLSKKSREIVEEYFSKDKPEILRFHGAYPVGNWAATLSKTELEAIKKNNKKEKIPYRIVDVVHPQQSRQVQGEGTPMVIPVMSFYNPTFIFELSCTKELSQDEEWKKIEGLLRTALQPGLGGKTSSGYGLFTFPQNRYPVSISLKGTGVSSTLRGGIPEFRPNMFKATVRGHVSRLLAGACENKREVQNKLKDLFGSNTKPGLASIFWEYKANNFKNRLEIGEEKTPAYEIKGNLHLDVRERNIKSDRKRQDERIKDLKLLQYVLQFTYTMGGIGKSWRRVWHQGVTGCHPGFMPSYDTRAIGCHWEEGDWLSNHKYEPYQITSVEELTVFLNELHQFCSKYMGQNNTNYLDWKEAWHPSNLKVYAKLVKKSELIHLFHNDIFKTTPAIGGRKLDDDRPTSISSVWHRMLPIDGSNRYLEIITLFTSKESDWIRTDEDGEEVNQLNSFIKAIQNQNKENRGFQLLKLTVSQ